MLRDDEQLDNYERYILQFAWQNFLQDPDYFFASNNGRESLETAFNAFNWSKKSIPGQENMTFHPMEIESSMMNSNLERDVRDHYTRQITAVYFRLAQQAELISQQPNVKKMLIRPSVYTRGFSPAIQFTLDTANSGMLVKEVTFIRSAPPINLLRRFTQ